MSVEIELNYSDYSMSGLNFLKYLTMGCACGKETITIEAQKFSVCSRLGEGGFSVIDLIEDRLTKRLYAMKRIMCHSEQDERDAMREVQYMSSFRHRNLVPCDAHTSVPVKNHRTAISEVLIVMPFYKKGSLYDELERLRYRSETMQELKILMLLSGICDGILALHSNKTLPLSHRDIKPHNIMFETGDDGDVPILMDFGSMGPAIQEIKGISDARKLQDFAAEKCSMPYRAPELFQVESYCTIDERVDIWSLGCTLHAMCFYESPFEKVYQRGDSIALAAMAGNVKVPEKHAYSRGLIELMRSMLTVNPMERPKIESVIIQLEELHNSQTDRV